MPAIIVRAGAARTSGWRPDGTVRRERRQYYRVERSQNYRIEARTAGWSARTTAWRAARISRKAPNQYNRMTGRPTA